MALTAKKVYAILKRQISDMEAKLNSPVRYRGTVATADLLPLNPDIGDMYNIESKSIYGEAGMNVAWNGVVWDTMGAPIDMSLYFTKEEAEAVIQRLVTEYFEKNPVKPGATTEQAQQIEQNKTDIASLKTETASLKEDLSNIIQDQYEILINKRMNVILGEFEKGSINADGSNQDVGAGNLLRTKKYIKLYPVPYTFKTINGNGLSIYIYDSNGIFLRAEFMAATMGERSRTITFLETDYKCRIVINSYNNDYENYPVKTENIESIIIDISATKKSKTICCIGDSFTASTNSWHTYIRNRMGYNMINLGVAGTRISVSYTSGSKEYTSFIERVENGVLDAYTPDLIIVFGGINDTVKLHNAQMTIGTINDSAEYSPTKTSGYSFIGRVKYLIELIKSKKPGVPILGVIPPNYSEGTSNFEWWSEYISQIQDALRSVYEYYGILYVDLKKTCQEMYEDSYNLATYRIDGRSNMHPSVKGHKAIGKRIEVDGINKMFDD